MSRYMDVISVTLQWQTFAVLYIHRVDISVRIFLAVNCDLNTNRASKYFLLNSMQASQLSDILFCCQIVHYCWKVCDPLTGSGAGASRRSGCRRSCAVLASNTARRWMASRCCRRWTASRCCCSCIFHDSTSSASITTWWYRRTSVSHRRGLASGRWRHAFTRNQQRKVTYQQRQNGAVATSLSRLFHGKRFHHNGDNVFQSNLSIEMSYACLNQKFLSPFCISFRVFRFCRFVDISCCYEKHDTTRYDTNGGDTNFTVRWPDLHEERNIA